MNGSDNMTNPTPEQGSDAVTGVETVTKKKKAITITAISAGAAAVLVGGAVVAYNVSDFVKNQVKLLLNDPDEYYAWVIRENAADESDKINEKYKNYLDRTENGSTENLNLKYDISDDARGKLRDKFTELYEDDEGKDKAGKFADNLSSVSLSSKIASKDGNSGGNIALNLNDETILSVDMVIKDDMTDFYTRIPELTERWLAIPLTSDEDTDTDTRPTSTEALIDIFKNPGEYFGEEDLGTIIERYAGVCADSLTGFELEKKQEVGIADISVNYTVLTNDLGSDGEKAYDLTKNILNTLKDDTIIKNACVKSGAAGEEDYKNSIDELIKELDNDTNSSEETDKTAVETLSLYVDPMGKLRGITLKSGDIVYFSLLCGEADNDDIGIEMEIYADEEKTNVTIGADSTPSGYTGDASVFLTYDNAPDDNKTYDIEFSDLKVVNEDEGFISGGITVADYNDIGDIALTFQSDGNSQDIVWDAVVDSVNYGKLTLNIMTEDGATVEIPAEGDALVLDSESGYSLEDYIPEDQMKEGMKNICAKLFGDVMTDEELTELSETLAEKFYQSGDEAGGIYGGYEDYSDYSDYDDSDDYDLYENYDDSGYYDDYGLYEDYGEYSDEAGYGSDESYEGYDEYSDESDDSEYNGEGNFGVSGDFGDSANMDNAAGAFGIVENSEN